MAAELTMAYKFVRGRAALDTDRAWYEEPEHLRTTHARRVMTDTVPQSLPALMCGGAVVPESGMYDANGALVPSTSDSAILGGPGRVRRIVRRALNPLTRTSFVDAADADSRREPSPTTIDAGLLRYALPGAVVEVLDDVSGTFDVQSAEYVVSDGCVTFLDAVPAPDAIVVVSFYAYVGRFGDSFVTAPGGTRPTADSVLVLADGSWAWRELNTSTGGVATSTDDVVEGSRLYLTTDRVVDIVRSHMSADDIAPGVVHSYCVSLPAVDDDVGVGESRESPAPPPAMSLLALTTASVAEEVGALYYTNERVLSCCANVFVDRQALGIAIDAAVDPRISDVMDRMRTEVVRASPVVDYVDEPRLVMAEDIVWGSDPYVARSEWAQTMQSIATLDTSRVTESAGAMYFTPNRATEAVAPLIEASETRVSALVASHMADASARSEASDVRVMRDAEAMVLRSAHDLRWEMYLATEAAVLRELPHDEEEPAAVIDETAAVARAVLASMILAEPVLTSNIVDDVGVIYTDARAVRAVVSGISTDDLVEGAVHRFARELTTADVPEGAGGGAMYHTPERVAAVVRDMTIDDLRPGSASFTDARVRRAVRATCSLDDIADGVVHRIPRTTADVAPAAGLEYWTEERASRLLECAATAVADAPLHPVGTAEVFEDPSALFFTRARASAAATEVVLAADLVNRAEFEARMDVTAASWGPVVAADAAAPPDHRDYDVVRDAVATMDVRFAALSTHDIHEHASSLFFTPARAVSALAETTGALHKEADAAHAEAANAISVGTRAIETTAALTKRADAVDFDLFALREAMSAAPAALHDEGDARLHLACGADDASAAAHVAIDERMRHAVAEMRDEMRTLRTLDVAESPGALYHTEGRVYDIVAAHAAHAAHHNERESFAFLLSHFSADDLREGQVHKYRDPIPIQSAPSTTSVSDEILDTWFERVLDEKRIATTDVASTAQAQFLTHDSLITALRNVNTDMISEGSRNRYFTPSAMTGAVTTATVTEAVGAGLYFTAARAQSAVTGMSVDSFVEGTTNLFCNTQNIDAFVRNLFIHTNVLATTELVAATDAAARATLRAETVAGDASVSSALSVARLELREHTDDQILSIAVLVSEADAELTSRIDNVSTSFANSLHHKTLSLSSVISATALALSAQTTTTALSLSAQTSAAALSLSASTSAASAAAKAYTDAAAHSALTLLVQTDAEARAYTSSSAVSLGSRIESNDAAVRALLTATTLSIGATIESNDADVRLLVTSTASSIGATIESTDAAVRLLVTTTASSMGATIDANAATARAYTDAVGAAVSSAAASQTSGVRAYADARIDALDTSMIAESPGHRFVSMDAIRAAGGVAVTDLAMQMATAAHDGVAGWTDAIATAFAHLTTDDVAEGPHSRFVSLETVRSVGLRTSDVSDAGEGEARYMNRRNMRAIGLAADDVPHGVANMYATAEAFDWMLRSRATTDDVVEGPSKWYVNRQSLAKFNVTDLKDVDPHARLLTDEAFLDSSARLLTTDTVREGATRAYVTPETVALALASLSTDDVAEGTERLFFTADRVRAVVDEMAPPPPTISVDSDAVVEGYANVFFTPQRVADAIRAGVVTTDDIADPSGLLHGTTDDLVEGATNAFFTPERARDALDAASVVRTGVRASDLGGLDAHDLCCITTDEVREGGLNAYYSDDRVKQLLTSPSPPAPLIGEITPLVLGASVAVRVPAGTVVGGAAVIEVSLDSAAAPRLSTRVAAVADAVAVFDALDPGSYVVSARLVTPFATSADSIAAVVVAEPASPIIDDVVFDADGFVRVHVTSAVSATTVRLRCADRYISPPAAVVAGVARFRHEVTFARGWVVATTPRGGYAELFIAQCPPLVVPAKSARAMRVETNAPHRPDQTTRTIFGNGVQIEVHTLLGTLDGNRIISRRNDAVDSVAGSMWSHEVAPGTYDVRFAFEDGEVVFRTPGDDTFMRAAAAA